MRLYSGSPFSISTDGVNTVLRWKGPELQYGTQQLRTQVGWGCSPLGAGRVQVCHSSILMPLPLGQLDIFVQFSTCILLSVKHCITVLQSKILKNMHSFSTVQKDLCFEQLPFIIKKKKKHPTLLPVIGLKGAISAANYNIKCTSCHRHLRIRVLIPYMNSDLLQKKTFMIKYCYFWIWNLHQNTKQYKVFVFSHL